jgi:hypothetical protein
MANSEPSRNAKVLRNPPVCRAFSPKITHSFTRRPEIIKDRERLDKFPEKRPFGYVIDLAEVANLAAEPRHLISQIVD